MTLELMACLTCLRFQTVPTMWERKMLHIFSEGERREFSIHYYERKTQTVITSMQQVFMSLLLSQIPPQR